MLETAAFTLLALAAILLVAAGGLVLGKRRFLTRAARAEGVVVALRGDEPIQIGGKAQMLRPVIRFVADHGREVEIVMAITSTPPPYRVGDAVPVRYDPSDPSATARVESFLGLWFVPSLLAGLAMPALIAGIAVLVWQSQSARGLAELRRTGDTLTGIVFQIDHDTAGIGPDGKPMYVLSVEARAPDTGVRLMFTSGPIGADRRKGYTIGDKVRVIVDPADPGRYIVELR